MNQGSDRTSCHAQRPRKWSKVQRQCDACHMPWPYHNLCLSMFVCSPFTYHFIEKMLKYSNIFYWLIDCHHICIWSFLIHTLFSHQYMWKMPNYFKKIYHHIYSLLIPIWHTIQLPVHMEYAKLLFLIITFTFPLPLSANHSVTSSY